MAKASYYPMPLQVKRLLQLQQKDLTLNLSSSTEEKKGMPRDRVVRKQHGIPGYKIKRTRMIAYGDGSGRKEENVDIYWPTFELYLVAPGVDPEPPTGQLARFLHVVGTFDPANPLERTAVNQQALGQLGYNPTSLLSIFAFPPYLHNGSCATVVCVLDNEAHRNAGGKVVLDDPAAREAVAAFVISIDGETEPINP